MELSKEQKQIMTMALENSISEKEREIKEEKILISALREKDPRSGAPFIKPITATKG